MNNSAYQQMAKDFIDLWQKQISSVVSDKQFIEAMLEWLQSVKTPHDTHKSSASHAADAPDANHGMLAELAFRLTMCEKRLAALEQRHKKEAGKRSVQKRRAARGKKPRR